MYLMDQISGLGADIRAFPKDWRKIGVALDPADASLDRVEDTPEALLEIYPKLRDKLHGCPRYLLDEHAIALATELTMGRPKILLDSLAGLRIPYPLLWIEWPESGRENLRQAFGHAEGWDPERRPIPDRIGFYLECDPGGRSGSVIWAWGRSEIADMIPNICPIECRFDLDRQFDQQPFLLEGFSRNQLNKRWADHPVQLAALRTLWRHSHHAPAKGWGESWLQALGGGNPTLLFGDQAKNVTNYAYNDVYGEWIQIVAVLLLLTAARPVIDRKFVDLSQLNRARTKRRRQPLCDYTLVTLHLEPHNITNRPRGPLGYARKSPRVHLVSSYLAHRGNKHWIVQPYLRGSGETISRHTRVTT